jgi:RNA polymerase sigma-70 factor (family 1)
VQRLIAKNDLLYTGLFATLTLACLIRHMCTIAAPRILYLQSRISRFNDQLAYKELFTGFYPTLFHFVFGIVKSRQSAEEIVSDLFMKIWEKRNTLEDIQNLRVYCYVAARHLSINQLEKQKRHHSLDIEDFKSQLVVSEPNPEQTMINAEMLKRIHEVIDQLPPRCRMSFKLVNEHGFKYKEAAEILQVSEKTIENQLSIALKKISAAIRFDIHRSVPVIAGFR